MVIETDENSELRELRSQLADTEQERNDFCAMVVDLETKLLESNTTSSPRPSSEELAQLQQRTAAAERLIRTSGADRADLEAKCAEYRQQGEQQRRTAYDLEATYVCVHNLTLWSYTRAHARTHLCVCVCVCTCMCICIYICVCVCVCV